MGSSFYGGRSGFSFVIVKSFQSVAEMVEEFQKGPEYSAVHFDEHVLINTENKNDPDNGKLYRRGYDYTNEIGGAVYIGTIVGPAGRAPMLELTTIEEVKKKHEEGNFDNRYSEGESSIPVSMVPGKDGETYNDVVEWACCSVRNENNEDTVAYIGFKFPYTVIDFTSQSVSPYYNRSNNTDNFVNENLSERTDDKTHPFYEKWNIKVPKGIKGDAFKNFRVMVADTSIQDYVGKQDDIVNRRKVLVYDYYNYDKDENGEPKTLYLGDYNTIDDIAIDDSGTVTINYSHDDTITYEKLIKWIDKITLDKDNGHLKVEYNYKTDNSGQSTTYETDLSWVSNITIAADGTATVKWSTGETEDLPVKLKYIDRVYFDQTDNKLHVIYNTGDDEAVGESINYILETDIDTNDYHLLVYYSNESYRDAIPAEKKRTHKGKDGWLDLGSIKDDSGILVGLNIPLSAAAGLNNISTAIAYLNSQYPNGLTNPKYYGKVVTIGDAGDNKDFYAFDYDKNVWYYLGAFENEDSWTIVCKEDDPTLETQKNKVAIGGVWFIVEADNGY